MTYTIFLTSAIFKTNAYLRQMYVSCLSLSLVKMEAKRLIKCLFSSIQRCESEADWKHLRDLAKPNAANRTAVQEDR